MKFGFRLVHKQDVEQLNQIMMNKSIIKSTTTCPTKSVDAQGQQCHDDEDAGPSGSGSSHQKSLFCNTYSLSEELGPEKEKRSMCLGLTYDSSLSKQEASQLLHFNSITTGGA
ncbi:PREDICTED: TMV resistance N [Prunus dulcis]|uniref:PREDICTED: TMV resistance N n=1 Tax=Prunus dulcis TaxID=3755 RepID=A0A5E4G5Z3_PRUDU|nr:PREDICTED: TMV resistance N [Prunus dulcis]